MAATTLENYPTQEAARMRLAKLELAEPVMAVVEQPDGTLAGGSLLESARALVKAGLAEDAGSVLAQSLSRRGAAWWACRVARLAAGGTPAPNELRALETAEAWVRQPEQLKAYYVGKGHMPATVEPEDLAHDYVEGLTKPGNWSRASAAMKGAK
jgi:hypothetical protein